MDLIYVRNTSEEEEIRGRIDALKEEIVNEAGAELGQQIVNEAKHSNGLLTVRENRKFAKKLKKVRNLKQAQMNMGFNLSVGSRKFRAHSYKKQDSNGELLGSPFPMNLRRARRQRPEHQQRPQPQEYQVTPEDLAARNPIILTDIPVDLDEDAKSLLRKSPKFVPTPLS